MQAVQGTYVYGIIPFLLSIAAWEVVLCTLQSAVPGTVVPGTRYKTLLTLEGPGKKDLLFSLLLNTVNTTKRCVAGLSWSSAVFHTVQAPVSDWHLNGRQCER
jgi:hypothetical protein